MDLVLPFGSEVARVTALAVLDSVDHQAQRVLLILVIALENVLLPYIEGKGHVEKHLNNNEAIGKEQNEVPLQVLVVA